MSNLSAVYYNDTANCDGIAISVYLSGCDQHCKGCHNPETWDFNYGEQLTDKKITEIMSHLHDNSVNRSLCILGGEPLHPKNLEATLKLIVAARINKVKAIYI